MLGEGLGWAQSGRFGHPELSGFDANRFQP
jgi:hypothetical protein